jgi:hypothetical protein
MTDDSDGAKEWVTVKVPKADKEQADEYRPDGSTFGNCLVAGAERLNDDLDSDTARFVDDDADITATVRPTVDEDALDDLTDEVEQRMADAVGEGVSPDAEAVAELLAERIDYPDAQTAETIAARLDDLESTLPRRVAEELQR